MASSPVKLPSGFVLEEPQQQPSNLPPGFVLEQPSQPPSDGLLSKMYGVLTDPNKRAQFVQQLEPTAADDAGTKASKAFGRLLTGAVTAPYDLLRAPQNSQEQAVENNSQFGVPGRVALAADRLVAQPAAAQFAQAKQDYRQGGANVASAGGHVLAAALPIVGPMAADIGQRLPTDPIGAIAQAAGTALLPRYTGEAARIASDLTPNLKPLVSRPLLMGKTPEGAYESALKPSTTIPAAKRAQIVATGLQEGIPVSKGGLEKLSSLIDDLNSEIRTTIQTNPNAPIPRDASAKIAGVTQRFATQAAPGADLKAISSTAADYNASHPAVMPAEYAQAVKEGTYARIGDRAYGEVGTATTETEKAIARHLKDEIALQFPEIKDLNAREGSALSLQDILERSVNRISNHQLIGIGTPAAAGAGKVIFGGAKGAAALATMKAILDNPAVKSRLAIMLQDRGVSPAVAAQRVNSYVGALGLASSRGSLQPVAVPQGQ